MEIKRTLAFLFDLFIAVIAIIPICIILYIIGINFENMMPSLIWGGMFVKDCLFGRSIGKYFMKLYIIDNETGSVPSPLKCVIRNITYIMGIFDFIPMFCGKGSIRLGEYITKTQIVTSVIKNKHHKIIKRLSTIIFVYLIIIIINLLISKYSTIFGLFGLLYK